jgi:hypothetical protein
MIIQIFLIFLLSFFFQVLRPPKIPARFLHIFKKMVLGAIRKLPQQSFQYLSSS